MCERERLEQVLYEFRDGIAASDETIPAICKILNLAGLREQRDELLEALRGLVGRLDKKGVIRPESRLLLAAQLAYARDAITRVQGD